MTDGAVQSFIEITQSDRRTALYCLQRHNNNLESALAFFYDANLTIPDDFMNDLTSFASLAPLHPSINSDQTIIHRASAPDIINNSPESISCKHSFPNVEESEIFFPFGNVPIGEPFLQDIDIAQMTRGKKITSPESLYPVLDSKNHNLIVYADGILFEDHFYDLSTDEGTEFMKSINSGVIPKNIFNGCPFDQFTLLNQKDKKYKEN